MHKRSLVLTGGLLLLGLLMCASAIAADGPEADNSSAEPLKPKKVGGSLQAGVAASFVHTGQQHIKARRFKEAAEDFSAALSLDPTLVAAREGLARAKAGLDPAGAVASEPAVAGKKPVASIKPSQEDLIRAQALARVTCESARVFLEGRQYEKAAEEYGKALKALAPLSKYVDVSGIEAEARDGLRRAKEGLQAAKAARPALKKRIPAEPKAPPAEKTAAKKVENEAEPKAVEKAEHTAAKMLERTAAEMLERPVPKEGQKPPRMMLEKSAVPELRHDTAVEESLREVGLMMRPQTSILATKDLPMKMKDWRRPKDDDTTQTIGGEDFQNTQDQDAATAMQAKLMKKVSVNFKDEPFLDVVQYMRDVADVNILVDPAVVAQARPVKGFQVVNMELRNVLKWLLQFEKLDYRVRNGAIFISDAAGLAEKPIMMLHNIADLTHQVKDFGTKGEFDAITGPVDTRYGYDMGIRHLKDDKEVLERTRQGEEWARFIRENVTPSTWSTEEGGVMQNTINYRSGKLVATHTREVQERIRELLASFRKARALQVAILARFIEINEDFLDDLSTSWSGLAGTGDVFGIVSPGDSPRVNIGITADPEVGLSPLGHATTGGLVMELGFLNSWQVQMIVGAVRKQKRGNILTAPRVTCFNTQRAYLTVTTRRNFVRGYDSDGNPEIGQVNDGIVFEVQPFVSADRRFITLELFPRVNMAGELVPFEFRRVVDDTIVDDTTTDDDATTDRDTIQLPEVTIREVRTTVSVPDGGTLMIGGLAQATESEGYATVPFLGDLPLIKHLFTSRRKVDARNNLVVLVTAHIIFQRD